jgi:hypothetical protein
VEEKFGNQFGASSTSQIVWVKWLKWQAGLLFFAAKMLCLSMVNNDFLLSLVHTPCAFIKRF